MPYKYVVSVDSKGFDDAPDVVLRALGRLTWATEKAVKGSGDPFLSPNELLILGYLEDMKIGVCIVEIRSWSKVNSNTASITTTANPRSVPRLPRSRSAQSQRCSYA